MGTKENLQAAFAGESQANRKYLAFALKAEQDRLPQVAKLFRAAAAAETVHAHAHLRVLGEVQATVDNLQAAMAGEKHEFASMYPGFIREAEAEGNRPALISFKNANVVEEVHYNLYRGALAAVQAGRDLPAADIWVCDICGNTETGSRPDNCRVCKAGKDHFAGIA